jgi:hypothetical protein
MKKLRFIIVAALAFTAVSQAQKIKIGVNAGATFSGFRGQEVPTLDYGPGFGFLGGLTFEYGLNERLSLRANPAYHRKSSKAKSQYETNDGFGDPWILHDQTITFNYDYVSLPIMAKYSLGQKRSFFLSGGIFAAYLLKSEARSKSDPPAPDGQEAPINTTSSNNKLDFGLSVGIGKSIALGGSNALTIELRDDLGLSKVGKYTNSSSNALNLLVGWSFDL